MRRGQGAGCGITNQYSLSVTLENAYTDYCLARFAEATGHVADAAALYAAVWNYRNVFKRQDGWFRGPRADGSWMGPTAGCIESSPH
jgi:putative alpha-1,2-mannosidase